MRPDLPYWLALVRFPSFGAVRMRKLSSSFPSMKEAFFASHDELVRAEIEPTIAERFIAERVHLDPDGEMKRLVDHHVTALTVLDASYPPALKTIYDPPAVLFVRGELPNPSQPHLAVVGSRHQTSYGERAVTDIVAPIAASGVVIVSGLAYGVDALAHHATLEAGGTTLAVLGAGLDDDNIYPSQNRALASRIMAGGGALVSEFPIGTHVLKQNFPFRNRVIAGLCRATLVVEAAEKSGSLITARCALESGRDVFAIPGSIHAPLCAGPNNLIKMGATPVTKPEDILNAFNIEPTQPKKHQPFIAGSQEEQTLHDLLSEEPLHVDELVERSALAAKTVTSTLTLMEMKGSARHAGGLFYVRG